MGRSYLVDGKDGFKFFSNGKIEYGFVLINQYGAIRFKSELAKAAQFEAGSRWLIGVNEEEDSIKYLYIFPAKKEDAHNGFKMMFQNKSWSITCKSLFISLKVKTPVKCKIEDFKHETYGNGFKIYLPQQ